MGANFYKKLNRLFFFSFVLLFFVSCGSRRNVIYFQGSQSQHDFSKEFSEHEVRIVNNDNLLIMVSSKNPQAAEVFNVIRFDRAAYAQTLQWQGFLVDQNGNINFPLIGEIRLGGLTKAEAIALLQEKISTYINDPVVNIRFMNYKVSVIGEVNRPGSYTVDDEKITIVQSLALAGDMTIYGNRRNIIVSREIDGRQKFFKVDITTPDIFNSPVYYLQQNDIVYVEPNKARVRSSTNYIQNASLGISLVSMALTIALFLKK
ncbi:MAG: polysaccharide export protein [Dysgonamonadaceae bacterium]|jgi:polysaccharide export outer membrane protein|nr:polysaccharide export protein [Dysgonamonadaceae bacterium]